MRDNTLLVSNTLPAADQVQKLDKKDRVMYIYAGKPSARYQDKFGTQARIQLNDKFATVQDVAAFVLAEKGLKTTGVAKRVDHCIKSRWGHENGTHF